MGKLDIKFPQFIILTDDEMDKARYRYDRDKLMGSMKTSIFKAQEGVERVLALVPSDVEKVQQLSYVKETVNQRILRGCRWFRNKVYVMVRNGFGDRQFKKDFMAWDAIYKTYIEHINKHLNMLEASLNKRGRDQMCHNITSKVLKKQEVCGLLQKLVVHPPSKKQQINPTKKVQKVRFPVPVRVREPPRPPSVTAGAASPAPPGQDPERFALRVLWRRRAKSPPESDRLLRSVLERNGRLAELARNPSITNLDGTPLPPAPPLPVTRHSYSAHSFGESMKFFHPRDSMKSHQRGTSDHHNRLNRDTAQYGSAPQSPSTRTQLEEFDCKPSTKHALTRKECESRPARAHTHLTTEEFAALKGRVFSGSNYGGSRFARITDKAGQTKSSPSCRGAAESLAIHNSREQSSRQVTVAATQESPLSKSTSSHTQSYPRPSASMKCEVPGVCPEKNDRIFFVSNGDDPASGYQSSKLEPPQRPSTSLGYSQPVDEELSELSDDDESFDCSTNESSLYERSASICGQYDSRAIPLECKSGVFGAKQQSSCRNLSLAQKGPPQHHPNHHRNRETPIAFLEQRKPGSMVSSNPHRSSSHNNNPPPPPPSPPPPSDYHKMKYTYSNERSSPRISWAPAEANSGTPVRMLPQRTRVAPPSYNEYESVTCLPNAPSASSTNPVAESTSLSSLRQPTTYSSTQPADQSNQENAAVQFPKISDASTSERVNSQSGGQLRLPSLAFITAMKSYS